MSFPRYPEYKDSGVEWLGEVPAHWEVIQSRRLFALRNERAAASDKQLTASQEHGVIYQEDFVRLEGRRVVEVIKGADILKHVEPNDFVISMRSFQGGIEWCRLRGCISSAYVMLVPCESIHGPFFAYLLKSKLYIQALQTTTNLVRDGQALRYGNFTQVSLPLVPLEEQSAIAAFLDRETAKVDALVVEQQRLIELLKEKRQAVISHAVTKGLNPDVPMTPSGVDWLGEVPAHWGVVKLCLLGVFKGGAGFPDPYQGQADLELPFFKVADISRADANGALRTANHTISSDTAQLLRARVFPASTIIFAKVGAALFLQRYRWLGQPSCIDNNMMGLMVNERCIPRFLLHVLPLLDLSLVANPGAVPSINEEQISSQRVALPPLSEQVAIVEHLDREITRLDALTAEAQRAIDLLEERRTALISAAVTGQIDVRAIAGRAAA